MMMAEDRRRATKAELVEKSKSNPGYYKYQVTIKELDGREHVVPSYGVDMQDAISRIVKKERTEKLSNMYYRTIRPITIFLITLLWLTSVMLSEILNDYRFAYTTSITLMVGSLVYAVYDYYVKTKNRV